MAMLLRGNCPHNFEVSGDSVNVFERRCQLASDVSYTLFQRDIEQIKFYMGLQQRIERNTAYHKWPERDTIRKHMDNSKAGKHGENRGLENCTKWCRRDGESEVYQRVERPP